MAVMTIVLTSIRQSLCPVLALHPPCLSNLTQLAATDGQPTEPGFGSKLFLEFKFSLAMVAKCLRMLGSFWGLTCSMESMVLSLLDVFGVLR